MSPRPTWIGSTPRSGPRASFWPATPARPRGHPPGKGHALKLINDHGFPTELVRAKLLYRDLTMATVVVKAGFQVEADGSVTPIVPEEQLAVSEADVVTPLGTIDGDIVPLKPGCDLALLGHARSPRADRPVERQSVEIRVGNFSRALSVFGDRAWVDRMGGPRPTAPVPFNAIPLTYDRAFGGSAVMVGDKAAPYPQNPDGRGYVRLRANVVGTRLPNVEEADQVVTSWEQAPLPGGTGPLPRASSLRLEAGGFGVDLEKELVQLSPAAFSFAHPRMRLVAYPGGATVLVTGVLHDGPWRFTLPGMEFSAALLLGDARYDLPLAVDTLCLFPDYRRFYVVARRAFVYQFLPQRSRQLTVYRGATPGTTGLSATTTIAQERKSSTPIVPISPAAMDEALPLPFEALLPLYPLTNLVEALPLCPSGLWMRR